MIIGQDFGVWEWIDLPIELTRETEAGTNSAHYTRNKLRKAMRQ